MNDTIKELVNSNSPDNYVFARLICQGLIRETFKEIFEGLNGKIEYTDDYIIAETEILYVESNSCATNYMTDDGKLIPFLDERFMVVNKNTSRYCYVDPMTMIQAVEYKHERLKTVVEEFIKRRLYL